jgi:L-lactate dehydrogenase complex protein LldG
VTHPAREEMLSRIKAALKTEAPHKSSSFGDDAKVDDAKVGDSKVGDSKVSADQIRRRCDERREGLIEQFGAELTRVGGRFFRAANVALASEYIERLAVAAGAKRMVGWDAPLLEKIAPPGSLEKFGVEFLRDRTGENDFVRTAIDSDIGITTVDYAMADTGTLVLISGEGRARSASLVPPVHVAVVEARQIIAGLDDLFTLMAENGNRSDRELASAITFITGPSRTADIELTLVVGVHGPQQLHVILLTE